MMGRGTVAACLLLLTGCLGNEHGVHGAAVRVHQGNPLYASGGLRRLTQKQYVNSIADLLGSDVKLDVTLDSDLANAGLTNLGAGVIATSPQAAAQYDSAARSLAKQRFADPNRRRAFAGCAPIANDATDACAAAFIAKFGRRAWRGPLDGEATARALQVYAGTALDASDGWKGLEVVTAMLLSSPQFVYRVEVGDAQEDGSVVLSSQELATRLAYLLTNSTPDDALLDAADSGVLATPDGLRAQAQRLLDLPRAHDAVVAFASEWLGYGGVADLTKDSKMFPAATSTLFAAMQQEFEHVVTDIVFSRNDDFTSLLSTRHTFVNRELAAFYGLPVVNSNALVPVDLPDAGQRAGLLTMGGFLASHAHQTVTAPTLRGFFVRSRLFCQDIPKPPANVPGLPVTVVGAAPTTMRQKLDAHRSNATCAACHSLMDPLGLSFEHFDALGAYRLDDGGERLDVTGAEGGKNFDGPLELAALLQSNSKVQDCIVRQVYRQSFGQMETADNAPVIASLGQSFASARYRLRDLLLAVVTSDAFRQTSGVR